jgi:hypothetical protein
MAAIQLKEELRTKALDKVVHSIREHNFTWDELHQAIMRAQAEKLIPTVREVIAGREFEYKRLGEYVIAMHKLCGGLPVVKYKDETGATVLTRINAGVIHGYLLKGEAAERVAEGFQIPVEAVKEVGELAALFDYDRRYA